MGKRSDPPRDHSKTSNIDPTSATSHFNPALKFLITQSRHPLLWPAWVNETTLGHVVELNSQLLEAMLRYTGTAARLIPGQPRFEVPKALQALSAPERLRLAKVRVVLLEAGFDNADLWSQVQRQSSNTQMEDSAWVDGYDLHALARSLYTLAWHLVQLDPDAAGVMLGMKKKTAEIFAGFSLRDLERVVVQRSQWVRPRWEAIPKRWIELIQMARTDSDSALEARTFQLLCGDLLETHNKAM